MTYKVAIVGAGTMGQLHAHAWSRQAEAAVVAVVDADPVAAQALANEHGAGAFPSLEDALDGVEIVSVCTPPCFHCQQVVAAVRAGAHVLLEKPAGVSLNDYDAMQQALDTAGVHLLVGVTQRFYPESVTAKRWIDEGRIGDLVSISESIRFDPLQLPRWYFDAEMAGGGVLLTNGIHSLDKLLWLTGAGDAEICRATLRNLGKLGTVEDFAEVDLWLDVAVAVHVHLLWLPGVVTPPRTEIVGSRGLLQVTPWQGITYLGEDGSEQQTFYPAQMSSMERTLVGIEAEARTLLAMIRGEQPPTSTLRQNRRIFELIHAIYQRADEQRSGV